MIPAGWARTHAVSAGPLTLFFFQPISRLRPKLFAPVRRGHYRPIKVLAVVRAGRAVTLSVPAAERGRLSLLYAPGANRFRPAMRVRDGMTAVRFEPCAGDSEPETQFGGGFVVAGARCASLQVSVEGEPGPLPLSVPFGRGCSDVWTQLRRPLQLPHLAAGADCPVAPAQTLSPELGSGQGKGPVYAVGAYPSLRFVYPPQQGQSWYGSSWGGQKVLFAARPDYQGPVLIRGGELGGGELLGFGGGLTPAAELRLPASGGSTGGWRSWPSYTRLRAGGCYAWQVDGLGFSEVIVFRAEIGS